MSNVIKLSEARVGDRGVITQVGHGDDEHGHGSEGEHGIELERRLLELGFVEGARIQLIHEGIVKRDPIALRVDDMTVALRRREAASLTVRLDGDYAEAAE